MFSFSSRSETLVLSLQPANASAEALNMRANKKDLFLIFNLFQEAMPKNRLRKLQHRSIYLNSHLPKKSREWYFNYLRYKIHFLKHKMTKKSKCVNNKRVAFEMKRRSSAVVATNNGNCAELFKIKMVYAKTGPHRASPPKSPSPKERGTWKSLSKGWDQRRVDLFWKSISL